MRYFGKALVLLLLAVITIYFSINMQEAPIKTTLTLQSVFTTLGGLFLIVLLIERVTEIAVSIWRQPVSEALRSEVKSLSNNPDMTDKYNAKLKEIATYQSETKGIALMIGFTISIIVCAAGVGLLSSILDLSQGPMPLIRGIDIVLTAGLLAGGSDGFHQFMSTLETFFNESKKKMETK